MLEWKYMFSLYKEDILIVHAHQQPNGFQSSLNLMKLAFIRFSTKNIWLCILKHLLINLHNKKSFAFFFRVQKKHVFQNDTHMYNI